MQVFTQLKSLTLLEWKKGEGGGELVKRFCIVSSAEQVINVLASSLTLSFVNRRDPGVTQQHKQYRRRNTKDTIDSFQNARE